jgi:hypothetical protein
MFTCYRFRGRGNALGTVHTVSLVVRVALQLDRNPDASKEIGLEVNVEIAKSILMSRQQDAGQNHKVKIANRCLENVE